MSAADLEIQRRAAGGAAARDDLVRIGAVDGDADRLLSLGAAGVHAVIAPKDRAAPLSDIAQQTAAGAAQSVPYVLVTNLARALDELVEAGVTILGLADEAEHSLHSAALTGPLAVVMGAEGEIGRAHV